MTNSVNPEKEISPVSLEEIEQDMVLANQMIQERKFQEAISQGNKSLNKIREINNYSNYDAILSIITNSMLSLGLIDDAIKMLEAEEKYVNENLNDKKLYDDVIHIIWRYQATFCLYRSELNKGLGLLKSVLQWEEKKNNKPVLLKVYNNLGVILLGLGNYKEALHNYRKAYEIAVEFNDPFQQAAIQLGAGACNFSMENIPEALAQYEESMKIAEENDIITILPRIYPNLSRIYMILGKFQLAENMLEKTQKLVQKTDDPIHESILYFHYGLFYQYKMDYVQSEQMYFKALSAMKQSKNELGIIEGLIQLAFLNINLGNYEKVRNLIEEVEEIYQGGDANFITTKLKILKALVMKEKGSYAEYLEVQRYLKEVSTSSTTSIEIKMYALLKYSDVLMEELNNTNNINVADELHTTIETLLELTSKYNTKPLLIQASLLKANFLFTQNQYQNALEVIDALSNDAQLRDLPVLKQKFSNLHHKLIKKLSSNQNLIDYISTDKILYTPSRLIIASYLYSRPGASFSEILNFTSQSKGNLSTNLQKLHEFDYIEKESGFTNDRQKPITTYRLTSKAETDLKEYSKILTNYIDTTIFQKEG